MTRRSVATGVAAVLGIAVSVALAWTASQLAGQRIGLASEPLSVATGLSPPVRSTAAPARVRPSDDHRVARRSAPARPPPATATVTMTAPAAPATSTMTPATAARASTTPGAGARAPTSGETTRHPGGPGDGGHHHDD